MYVTYILEQSGEEINKEVSYEINLLGFFFPRKI